MKTPQGNSNQSLGHAAHVPKNLGVLVYCRGRGRKNRARIASAFNRQNHPGFVCASHHLEQTRCATELDRDDHSQNAATHPLSRAQFLQAISKPPIHSDYPLIPSGLERVLKPLAGENLLLLISVPTAVTVLFDNSLKGMVPRDGVEPPTPAFSGLRSTT